MDAHDRFYARYGGREDAEAESHISKESLLRTMQEVLALHRAGDVQKSRYEPGREPVHTPEDIPTMRALLAPRKENKCIHCHDVKVAELKHLQQTGRFTRELVFTYPAPSAIGIELDRDLQNKVRAVTPRSFAEQAGVREGDMLVSTDGQRILTFADFTRVLELTPPESTLPLELRRGNQSITATLKLSGKWRRTQDPSWRESLHVAGPNAGFWGHKLDEEEREKLGLPAGRMAVLVTFIWGDHTRKAGIRKDDIVVKFDGLTRDLTIPQVHAHLNLNRNYGDSVPLTVRRGGQEHELMLVLPNERSKVE
jgi:C-terminal processing protease CtpA/Prc